MEDNSEVKALLMVWSIVFLSLSYCYFIVSKIPRGKFRLFFLFPVIFLYTILPFSLSSAFTIGFTGSFITWFTNSKLLLYAFDLGPLARHESDVRSLTTIKSFLKFIFLAAFPLKIKNSISNSINSSKVLLFNFWSKVLISSLLIGFCDHYRQRLHQGVILAIYSYLMCLLIDIAVGFLNMLLGPVMGVELAQPSDEPYMATSLQDFWARRWNLIVTDTLRHTVYNPTRVFLSKYMGDKCATVLATMAAFVLSAFMHELILYYVTRVSPSWEMMWFFVLHGVCVTVEVDLKRALGQNLRLGWSVSGPLTVGFVMGTAYLWFFPPFLRNHIDLRAFEELKSFYGFFWGIIKWCGSFSNLKGHL